jgi:Fic family protein
MQHKFYEGTPRIINLSKEIGKLLGLVDATYLRKPQTQLRRENKIKTIQSSLAIEGNTLSIDQVSTIFENKKVFGPAKDIREVKNAIAVYEKLADFDPFSQESYLEAHQILMKDLINSPPGKYRTKGVGIFKGSQVAHMAPPAWNVQNLMTNLFTYLKEGEDNLIIKSCVFHYEMEFIHPFMDGNGRMGRLWQTLILMQENPVFEFLPIEMKIRNTQQQYYDTLAGSDKEGIATKFVEYMLEFIASSLQELVAGQKQVLTDVDRLTYFREHAKVEVFSRKEYLEMFKDISSSTASRDLKKGVALGILIKLGDKRLTKYKFKSI